MGFAPVFDTPAVIRSAEVILVLRTLQPAALTSCFTLLAARRLGAVALVTHITTTRRKEIAAAEALAFSRTFIGELKNLRYLFSAGFLAIVLKIVLVLVLELVLDF